MNKRIIGIGVLSLVVLTLGLAGFAYAQGQPPQARDYPVGSDMMTGYGDHDYGMMGNGYGHDHAQDQTTPLDEYPHDPDMMDGHHSYDYGMMGDEYGMMGSGIMGWDGEEGPMHQIMIDTLAESLELSPQEIEARHDAGESLWDIAIAEGLSEEEIRELMFSAHDTVLENAISEGWLTQDQADWMDEHMEQMWDGDYGHCGGVSENESGVGGRGLNW